MSLTLLSRLSSSQCIEQLGEIGATKEDVFRVPGNHSKIKKLLSALENAQPFKVEDIVNPHTLNGFIKRTLKFQKPRATILSSARRVF